MHDSWHCLGVLSFSFVGFRCRLVQHDRGFFSGALFLWGGKVVVLYWHEVDKWESVDVGWACQKYMLIVLRLMFDHPYCNIFSSPSPQIPQYHGNNTTTIYITTNST